MSDDAIYPTGTCFDDAMELLEHIAKVDAESLHKYTLVHGIVLHPTSGVAYAHAWVETRTPQATEIWQGGIWTDHRVMFAVSADEFTATLRPQRIWRYTPVEAVLENRRTGHFGPWVEELRPLLVDRDRTHDDDTDDAQAAIGI